MTCNLEVENATITQIVLPFVQMLDPSQGNTHELVFVPLKGGSSKATLFRFVFDKRNYVLRMFPSETNRLKRMQQMMLAMQAAKIKVGPEVYFVDPQMEGYVMEYISGKTIQLSDFEDLDQVAKFAKFLKQLHQSTEQFPIACSPFQRFKNFVLKAEQKNKIYPARFNEIKELMEELEITFQLSPIPLVPSHLDLHPLNIMMMGEKFFLVDWVNGGMSDPYFDLATFSVFHCLNESQKLTFLTHYLEHIPTQLEWNRFTVTQPVRLFVIAAILLAMYPEDALPNYEDALNSADLPTIRDFVKAEKNFTQWQFGLTMYKEALEMVDKQSYKAALQSLQKVGV